jgi:archaemetzincin
MNKPNITLITFAFLEKDFLDNIFKALQQEFQCSINLKEGHLDLSEFYDAERRQYNGNYLIKEVDSLYSSNSTKSIGLFNIDLFIPILTFIFGQAFLNGNTSIVSLFRLNNERYGMIINDNLFLDRVIKEIIHELGHTFGLTHCYTPTCVMRASTYVEDIDQKSQHFCSKCKINVLEYNF